MRKISDDKKEAIKEYLFKQVGEKGYPPSIREIRDALGFKSTSTVHSYIEKLEREGYLKKDPSKPRALQIYDTQTKYSRQAEDKSESDLTEDPEITMVPVLGRITAGMPVLAVENIEDQIPVPARFTHHSEVFMLRVSGESMIDAGILDGDLILVRSQPSAENGEIVVAIIDEEATVKTFYREQGHFRLQPENRFYDPIIVNDDLRLLGKVIGVMRFF
ncbi:MAG TPA: repressor LexA [Clostridiales bacterium]|nr:repressor LexA [Clostridiales bacterium]